MKQLLLAITQAPAPTFANFVRGANAELVEALQAAVRGRVSERLFYLWGESAAGKTHLLRSFAEACGEGRARYLPADAYGPGVEVPILALDDVERLEESRQIALFNALNEGAFTRLIVSASSAPRDVPLRRDLATRLATGLTYRVLALTDPDKRAALAAHARTRGFDLSEEVTSYLLTHGRRDMGSLMAALDALDRYSLENGRPVTVPMLKAALEAAR